MCSGLAHSRSRCPGVRSGRLQQASTPHDLPEQIQKEIRDQ